MILRILRVKGNSLKPAFEPGDYVLVAGVPWLLRGIRAGDTIVFRHAGYGTLIKRVARLEEGGRAFYVLGTDEDSVDSRRFGAVPRAAVIGKVIGRLRRR